ncbi:MAG: hypothetical protein JW913_14815 [Chitinispirillaceae bacterium]|nr:hypothetical protein [Chitinispirillaceae bacterium]
MPESIKKMVKPMLPNALYFDLSRVVNCRHARSCILGVDVVPGHFRSIRQEKVSGARQFFFYKGNNSFPQ